MYISLKLINKTVRFTGGELFDTYRALELINKVVSYAGVVYYSLSDQIYRHTDVQTCRHADILTYRYKAVRYIIIYSN